MFYVVSYDARKLNSTTPTLIYFIFISFPITKNHNFAPIVLPIAQNSN